MKTTGIRRNHEMYERENANVCTKCTSLKSNMKAMGMLGLSKPWFKSKERGA